MEHTLQQVPGTVQEQIQEAGAPVLPQAFGGTAAQPGKAEHPKEVCRKLLKKRGEEGGCPESRRWLPELTASREAPQFWNQIGPGCEGSNWEDTPARDCKDSKREDCPRIGPFGPS